MNAVSYNRLTLLKIIAVLAMIIDHYNKFLNDGENAVMFGIGRIALPIFLFVLGYNLAHIKPEHMLRIIRRLMFFGLLAIPAYNAMGGGILWGWWPLNVLFLLAGLVSVVYLWSPVDKLNRWRQLLLRTGAVLVFLMTGLVAEFWFFGLFLGLYIYRLFSLGENAEKWRIAIRLLGVLISLLILGVVNGNQWALASVPVIALVLALPEVRLPRGKWFFYWFYPAHLVALWVVKVYI